MLLLLLPNSQFTNSQIPKSMPDWTIKRPITMCHRLIQDHIEANQCQSHIDWSITTTITINLDAVADDDGDCQMLCDTARIEANHKSSQINARIEATWMPLMMKPIAVMENSHRNKTQVENITNHNNHYSKLGCQLTRWLAVTMPLMDDVIKLGCHGRLIESNPVRDDEKDVHSMPIVFVNHR